MPAAESWAGLAGLFSGNIQGGWGLSMASPPMPRHFFFVINLLALPWDMWDLIPQWGMESMPTAVEAGSLNHCATLPRYFDVILFLIFLQFSSSCHLSLPELLTSHLQFCNESLYNL